MKTPVRTRLLSALLSLVMLVSLLPVSVFAAEPEAGTWTKVELADITADDTVAITMTKGDSTWVLPNNGDAKAAAKAITGTVSGNTLTTSEKDLFGWKVVKGADSFQLVSAATGKYLYSTSSNNGIRQGTGENRDWVVDTESGYLKNVALSRYVGVYNNQDWRSYTSVHANIAGQTLGFWKLSTVPARESGIVTDLTTLQNGDKVVVFNPANKKALSSVYNGFYNTGVDVELTGGKLTGYTNAELWTVNRTESGAYTFSTADGKKLSMDEKYSSTPLDKANVDWELSAAATADCFYIKNVGRGSYLEWYAEKNNWSSYGTIGSNEALFAQQLYLVADTQEPGQPGQPEDPSAPLKNGDQVVIYNPANLKALSSEYTGFYNKGTDVTLTGGKLAGFTEADIWTASVNDDGSYTFSTAEGKKLSMDEKYSSTPLDKAHTAWTLEQAATEGCYYIKNVGRSSYLEWYAEKNNWSAFGTIGSNEALFAQAFFKIQKSGIVTSVSDGDQVVVFNPANGKALSTEYTGFYNKGTDVTLADIARLTDVFYIGGTKVGALCGEAVVFPHGAPAHFMTMVKQQGALLAKGRLMGIQFDVLFTDDLYTRISRNAIETANALKKGLAAKGYRFFMDSPTNQLFVVLENTQLAALEGKAKFGFWEKFDDSHTVVRIATSWATKMEEIEQLIALM